MTKSPFLNALAATGYILFIALVMNFVTTHAPNRPDTFLAPLAIVSLFTLSAAVMAYIFLSEPLQLFLTGKRHEAIKLFIQTIFVFAGITTLIFILLLSGLIR